MDNIKYRKILSIFKKFEKEKLLLLFICGFSTFLYIKLLEKISNLLNLSNFHSTEAKRMILNLVLLTLIYFLFEVVQSYKWHSFRMRIRNFMYVYMTKNMMYKDINWFEDKNIGNINSSILNDGAMISEHSGIGVIMGILNIFHAILIVGVISRTNKILGIIVFIVGILYFQIIKILNGEMRASASDERMNYTKVVHKLNEMIRGIVELKVFISIDYFINQFKKTVYDEYEISQKRVTKIQMLNQSVNSIMKIIFPIFTLLLFVLIDNNAIKVGSLFFIYSLTRELVEPLSNLGDYYQAKEMMIGVSERVYDFLFDENVETEIDGIDINSIYKIDIDIDKIIYTNRDIDLKVEKILRSGDMLLIKGESGSGKSSLLKTLLGILEYDGDILINDIELDKIDLQSYYSNLTCVFQEPSFFEGSIKDNICLGEEYPQDEIIKAIDFSSFSLKDKIGGLEYMVAENGKNLSGGEKKRLSLARAYIRNPKLLILDEVTSGIDLETRDEILKSISDYIVETNSIVIAISHDDTFDNLANHKIELKTIY